MTRSMHMWRRRGPTELAKPRPQQTSACSQAALDGSGPRRRSLTPGDKHVSWLAEDADVGVTRASLAAGSDSWSYEISLRFPRTRTRWLVQRSFADFQRFHSALETAFRPELHARRIQLPQPSRRAWDAFRAPTHRAAAAEKLRRQLNGYLHKLLEIERVHASAAFRSFVTPRPASSDSTELEAEADTQAHGLLDAKTQAMTRQAERSSSTTSTSTSDSLSDSSRGVDELPRPLPSGVPPPSAPPSRCSRSVHFGGSVALTALGGLAVGLTKRSALSGSQKAVAVAAGVAGVALTGPLSAVLALGALGGGVGKYQLNKASYLTLAKSLASNAHATGTQFVLENAEQFSGPRRVARFGDAVHLYCHSVRKSVRVVAPPNSKRGHAMAAGADSCKTTLRFVSPYGRSGPLRCGSQVYVQLVDGDWAGQFLGVQGEFLTATRRSPAVFQLGLLDDAHDAVKCPETSTKLTSAVSKESVAQTSQTMLPRTVPQKAPFKLRVMVYNVWLLPSIVSSFNGKLSPWAAQRASAIPRCLASLDVDVVVFCEAFCASTREKLVTGMKTQGFVYETKVVGAGASLLGSKKAIDGGCFAMSKFPVSGFDEATFGSVASGDDRMADKGVVYFQVRVPVAGNAEAEASVDTYSPTTQTVHVVGTHLQAWETPVARTTRKCQLMLVREFIDSLNLPKEDPVIFAGDMNVNKHAEGAQALGGQYTSMLELLNAHEPALAAESPVFSFDPLTNTLAVDGPSSGGVTERLDYVMVDRHHRQPITSSTSIVQLKAASDWAPPLGTDDEVLVDLSDHYPVIGHFQF